MFVYFAALLSMASAANLCCSPDQWQANVELVMDTFSNGQTTLIKGSMNMSYDAVNKMIAYDQNLVVKYFPIKQRIVLDYKKGIIYTINNGTCTRANNTEWVPRCIPGNATLISDKAVFGLGNNSVQIKVYNADILGLDTTFAVTADTCVPVHDTLTGKLLPAFGGGGNTEMMQSLSYLNVKPGIADRSVFAVPAQCNSMQVQPVGRRSLFFNLN